MKAPLIYQQRDMAFAAGAETPIRVALHLSAGADKIPVNGEISSPDASDVTRSIAPYTLISPVASHEHHRISSPSLTSSRQIVSRRDGVTPGI
ncbi:MAG: hypothetical protein AAYR33_05260 [Acetobacteraceae bacterium]